MNAAETIRETKHALFERGWTKKAVQNERGELCILGALNLATTGNARGTRMASPLFDAVYYEQIRLRCQVRRVIENSLTSPRAVDSWNDEPHRTFDDVIDLLDRAEKWAETHTEETT